MNFKGILAIFGVVATVAMAASPAAAPDRSVRYAICDPGLFWFYLVGAQEMYDACVGNAYTKANCNCCVDSGCNVTPGCHCHA